MSQTCQHRTFPRLPASGCIDEPHDDAGLWMLMISTSPLRRVAVSPIPLPNRARTNGEACEIDPLCRVGFVLPDNPVSSLAAIISYNSYGRSKTNFAYCIRIRNDSCGRPTCAPIAKVSGRSCHQRVACRFHLGFDLL